MYYFLGRLLAKGIAGVPGTLRLITMFKTGSPAASAKPAKLWAKAIVGRRPPRNPAGRVSRSQYCIAIRVLHRLGLRPHAKNTVLDRLIAASV